MMSVQRSRKPDVEPEPQPSGQIYAITPEVEGVARLRVGASEVPGRRGGSPGAVSKPGSDVARRSAMQPSPSRNMSMLPPFAAAFAVRFGGAAAAFECPKHIADTQALIDKVGANLERDEDLMPDDMVGLAYALLDDARMFLEAARSNHQEPQRPHDHARAFAKADAALGHARAAENLRSRSAQPRR